MNNRRQCHATTDNLSTHTHTHKGTGANDKEPMFEIDVNQRKQDKEHLVDDRLHTPPLTSIDIHTCAPYKERNRYI